MNDMFRCCYSLTKLDLSNFKTQNVINMSYMFYSCKELTKLDLSNFIKSVFSIVDNIFFFNLFEKSFIFLFP